MSAPDWLRLGAGRTSRPLAGGGELRLLTAREVLEARREAYALAEETGRELALCSNACLVAKAWEKGGAAVYPTGAEALDSLSEEAIQRLASLWAAFDREENPGLGTENQRADHLKDALARMPQERLKWKVLRTFGALPTEERAKAMTGRDYLWCALHLLLDEEEEAERLCPACRAEAEKDRCPVCGCERDAITRGENAGFDLDRFLRLKKGGDGG